jgi:hypothetical protein
MELYHRSTTSSYTASFIERGVEKVLVNLLSVEGALCAWQKIPSSQEGVFRLLAEFYDASCAPPAFVPRSTLTVATLKSSADTSQTSKTPKPGPMILDY